MSAELNVEIDKSLSYAYLFGRDINDPILVCMDKGIVGDVGYKDSKVFAIPAGKHDISIRPKLIANANRKQISSETLGIEVYDGDRIDIICYEDTELRRVYLVDKKDKVSVSSVKRQARRSTRRKNASVMAYIIGGLTFVYGLLMLLSNYIGIEKINEPSFMLGFHIATPMLFCSIWGSSSYSMVISGFLFLVLGILGSKKTNVSLLLAAAIYGFDGYAILFTGMLPDLPPFSVNADAGTLFFYIIIISVRICFLIPLVIGTASGFLYKKAYSLNPINVSNQDSPSSE